MRARLAAVCILFAEVICNADAWSPAPKQYGIVLKHPSDGETSQASLYPPDGPVHVMEGTDIDDMIAKRGKHSGHPVLIAMYAAWCPHCWHLVPSLVRLAKAFEGQKEIEIAAINCADMANSKQCTDQGVTAFPDLRCFGCPTSTKCPKMGCQVTVGFAAVEGSEDRWLANYIDEATSIKPANPQHLANEKQKTVQVALEGPPGKPGFVPEFFMTAPHRVEDGMRGFLTALWSKANVPAATEAVNFMVKLFGANQDGLPQALQHPAIANFQTLATSLQGVAPDDIDGLKAVLVQYGQTNQLPGIGKQDDLAVYKDFILSPGDEEGFKTCTTFTCALWTFLHVTAASAAFCGGSGHESVSSDDVMKFVRGFVSEFLQCEACRQHFLRSYDACEFGRCSVKKDTDWAGVVLWLWRVHEGVNLRTAARDKAPVDRRWPSFDDCSACWNENNLETAAGATGVLHDASKIGTLTSELDKPYRLSMIYDFLVYSYIGRDALISAQKLWTRKYTFPEHLRFTDGQDSQGSNAILWLGMGVVVSAVIMGLMAYGSLRLSQSRMRKGQRTTMLQSGEIESMKMIEEADQAMPMIGGAIE